MTSFFPRQLAGVSFVVGLIAATGVVVVPAVAQAAPTGTGTITGSGYVTGTRSGVFRDINANGTWDTGEPGQGDISVTARCIADDGTEPASSFDDVYGPPTTTTTADSGAFTLSGPNVRGLCRVEFAIPADMQYFLQPGVASAPVAAPNSAGSFVQFVDARLNPTVRTAVHNPADFVGSTNPAVATGVSLPGASAAAANNISAAFNTVVRTNYTLDPTTALAQGDETGAIWGIAFDPVTETVFASSVIKRHAGIGPAGPDAIYAFGPNVPAAWATPFTAVDTDAGAILSDAARGLGNGSSPSDDDLAFAQAGTLSWGDIDMSEDGRTLYGVNLRTKTVEVIDIATKTAGAALTIPNPGCTNGVSRPWGLEVNDGLIYAGVVCDASGAGGTAANLAAFVYAYNPGPVTLPLAGVPAGVASGTWSANLLADGTPAPGVQLDYTKGCAVGTSGCGWNPWDSTYTDAEFNSGPSWAAVRPQPILSDLDVDDDGSLILAFADRSGFQFGYRNRRPQSTDQRDNLEGVIGGDVLRAGRPLTDTGPFLLESGGSVAIGTPLGGGTITGAANSEGPGGGEVYSREQFASVPHSETSLGSVGKLAGRSDYLMSVMDPLDTDSGGIGTFPSNGAARTDEIELYDSTGTFGFGKGSGLADLEILTQLAPVEIGNRVWRDDNGNGIQDPSEPPIPGVQVQLQIGATTYTATTDANGQYLFSSIARTGATTAPLLAAANYRFDAADDIATIRILNASGGAQQAPLAGMRPTEANDATANAPNVGGNNSNDSDGVVNGTSVEVIFTLGALAGTNDSNATAGDSVDREGYNRHIFDFGFVPPVSLGNRVWFDTDNDSTLDAGEQPVAGVAVQLFYDANANGVIDATEQTPVAYDTTDSNGLYLFDQFTNPDGTPLASPRPMGAGNYVVGIAPSNFTGAGPLVSYHSSGTTVGGTGVIGETAAPDPDTTSNTDDNGTRQPAGFFAGGVLSSPVTVTVGTEPATEETGVFNNNVATVPDTSSNLTVDFGFYRMSVGNVVWVDDGRGGGNDDDGIQNGGEPGLDGVPVRLYAADGTTEIPVGADGILGTADDGPGGVVTAGGGIYNFSGLPQGTYVVQIDAPTGYRSSTDPPNVGTPLASDADDNGPGTATGTISSAPFTLVPGVTANGHVPDNPTGTTSNPRVDFGLVPGYDLTIVKVLLPGGPYVPGAPVTFNLTASNLGPGVALDGLTVTDRLPAGLTYAATAADGGTEWTCAAAAGQEVTCTWNGPTAGLGNDVLASGASAPVITINATVDDPAPTAAVTNYAVVEPSPNQSVPETIPVGTTPDRFEDGNPATGSNNDDSAQLLPIPVYSLGDLVWIDEDGDGQFDPTELPIEGVTVTLLNGAGAPAVDAIGNPVPPTATGPDGRYQFDSLAPGDFQVQFTRPTGYVWTTPNAGDDGLDSDPVPGAPDAPTATTPTFTLSATPVPDSDTSPNVRLVTNPTLDAGVVPLVSLGDVVWIDTDGDGQFDPTELPLAGVTVTLLDGAGAPATDALGNPVAAATTDPDGRYSFTNLVPGDYEVVFTLPSGYAWTEANVAGGDDGLDSDAIAATPTAVTASTGVFPLSSTPVTDPDPNPSARDVTNPTLDAGVVPLVSLGDLVWIDADQDGQFGPTETPLAGVTVVLLDGNGDPATDAAGNPVPAATTDADGRYSFIGLLPGDYQVAFGLPTGYAWTDPNLGGDGLDSDAEFTTRTQTTAVSDVFTLSATPVADPDGNPAARDVTNPTIDAGVVPIVSLGDVVWIDENRNGQYNAGELPAPFVTVTLLDGAGSPATNANGVVVPPVGTDADGRYSFENLLPGDYQVRFTLPTGFAWTTPDVAGGDDGLDSDAIPASATAPTATSGVITLTATPVADSDTRPSARDVTDPTVDAGIVPILSLGDLVWVDENGDGQFDQAEPPFPGVTVTLLDGAGNPATDINGNPVAPATTDADGRYSFTNLPPGQYQVVFTLPTGYAWTTPNVAGGNDGLDSDVVPAAPDEPTASTGVFTLSSTPVNDPDTNPAARDVTNPTIDAGIRPIVSLGDLVWIDSDGDGQFDPTEPPLAGVTVTLQNATGGPVTDTSGAPVAPTTTDVDGRYSFENLLPGDYQVVFTLPSGYFWTGSNAGGDDGLDSDATFASNSDATATSGVFTLTGTPVTDSDDSPNARPVTNPTIDAGVRPLLSVGDLVWFDVDRDGQLDPGESPAPGVTVRLLDPSGNPVTNAAGQPVGPVTTDANGRYQFDGLLPGDYQIVFTLPPGSAWTVANSGNDGLDSDAVASTPTSPTASTGVFTLGPTPVTDTDPSANRRPVTNPTLDAGIVPLVAVGDYIWRDRDRDGIQDPGEPPVAGMTVTLLNPDGTPARDANGNVVPPQTTGADGRYVFDKLLPGSYIIEFGNIPSGFQFTTPGAGGGSDSNAGTTGRTPVFTLTPGDPDLRAVGPGDPTTVALLINPTIDAGIYDPLVDGLAQVPTTTTVPPTTQPIRGLPSTGSEIGDTLLLALLTLLVGGVFVAVTRRRGSTAR